MIQIAILALILTSIHSSTIFTTPAQFRCSGNFQYKNGRCVPCNYGNVALNGKCVALNLSFAYGSNIQQKYDINCERNRFFFGVCLKCKNGFYLDENSKCKSISTCQIFQLATQKCLLQKKDQNEIEEQNQLRTQEQIIQNGEQREELQLIIKSKKQKKPHIVLKSEVIELVPLFDGVPAIFTSNVSQKQKKNDLIYLEHQNQQNQNKQKKCQIPQDNKKCLCQGYVYHGVHKTCVKALERLFLSASGQIQLVDQNCKKWSYTEQSQQYKCESCFDNYQFIKDLKQCKQKIVGCLKYSQIYKCLECSQNLLLKQDGKCI